MKYIKKGKEPSTLKKYRETTDSATYKGFVDTDQLLKKQLLIEQGYICAYCMKRISLKRNRFRKPSIEVEHYDSQYERPDLVLEYKNMLGVCNGYLFDEEHCDKKKKEYPLNKINPLNKDIESFITYSLEGRIVAAKDFVNVIADLEDFLNLNNQHLIDIRKNTIDKAKDLLIKKHPSGTWTKALIQKEIDTWKSKDTNGRFRPFCQIAVWFWEQQKQRNRYPEK